MTRMTTPNAEHGASDPLHPDRDTVAGAPELLTAMLTAAPAETIALCKAMVRAGDTTLARLLVAAPVDGASAAEICDEIMRRPRPDEALARAWLERTEPGGAALDRLLRAVEGGRWGVARLLTAGGDTFIQVIEKHETDVRFPPFHPVRNSRYIDENVTAITPLGAALLRECSLLGSYGDGTSPQFKELAAKRIGGGIPLVVRSRTFGDIDAVTYLLLHGETPSVPAVLDMCGTGARVKQQMREIYLRLIERSTHGLLAGQLNAGTVEYATAVMLSRGMRLDQDDVDRYAARFTDTAGLVHVLANQASQEWVFNALRQLHKCNVAMDATDAKGNTVLHLAAEKDNREVANLFLEFGLRPDSKNGRGRTPRSIAVSKGHAHIVALFDAVEARRRMTALATHGNDPRP